MKSFYVKISNNFLLYFIIISLNHELIVRLKWMINAEEECYFSKKCQIRFYSYADQTHKRIVCYDFNYLMELNSFCGVYKDVDKIEFYPNRRQLLDKSFNLSGIKTSFDNNKMTTLKLNFFLFRKLNGIDLNLFENENNEIKLNNLNKIARFKFCKFEFYSDLYNRL